MTGWQGRDVANGAVVTIGVFDGVHRGHQALIGRAVERARETGQRAVAVTFDPNPLEVLRPDHAPTRLTSLGRRVELIHGLGVDAVEVLSFDDRLAATPAEDFARVILRDHLGAIDVVIGHGFRFGNRASGSAQTLRDAGLAVEEYALLGGEQPVSSTRVRASISVGEVERATQMLSRSPEVEGVVVHGERRGRQLGYPTANVRHHELAAVPSDGVYAGYMHVAGTRHASAISVGTNPTFGGQARTVESYLLDFDDDLYGQQVRVDFVQRLRAMESFDGVAGLLAQMADDVISVRRSLGC